MKADVKVGDEVVVMGGFRREGRHHKVVKVGTKYVYVSDGVAYHRETQYRRDGYSGRFMTLAQYEESNLRTATLEGLRTAGVQLTPLGAWTTANLVALREFVAARLEPEQ